MASWVHSKEGVVQYVYMLFATVSDSLLQSNTTPKIGSGVVGTCSCLDYVFVSVCVGYLVCEEGRGLGGGASRALPWRARREGGSAGAWGPLAGLLTGPGAGEIV